LQQVAIETLLQIFIKAADIPDVKRDLSNFQFARFCDLLLGSLEYSQALKVSFLFQQEPQPPHLTNGCLDSLSQPVVFASLEKLMIPYASLIRTIGNKIEAACLKELENNTEGTGHHLCLVQLASTGKAEAKDLWIATAKKAIGTLHKTFSDVFASVEEDSFQNPGFESFTLQRIQEEKFGPNKLPRLLQRIGALFSLLNTTFCCDLTVPVNIPSEAILVLICRVIAVTPNSPVGTFSRSLHHHVSDLFFFFFFLLAFSLDGR